MLQYEYKKQKNCKILINYVLLILISILLLCTKLYLLPGDRGGDEGRGKGGGGGSLK